MLQNKYQPWLILGEIFLSLASISQGLLIHPYQTMQSLVRQKYFVWMVLLPLGVLSIAWIGWRGILVPMVRLAFSCQQAKRELVVSICAALPWLSRWLVWFCGLWQLTLLYLLVRFGSVFWSGKNQK